MSPNCRLMTRNGCSTFARTLALRRSRFWATALRCPSGSLAMSLGRGSDMPLQALTVHARLRTPVARVGPHVLFLAVQQIGNLLDVGLIGRRGGDRVHQAAIGIHRDVRVRVEVPLVALLGLVHLGVTHTLGVLGRAGHGDDGRVHDAAALERQALALQMLVDRREDILGQVGGGPSTVYMASSSCGFLRCPSWAIRKWVVFVVRAERGLAPTTLRRLACSPVRPEVKVGFLLMAAQEPDF
jgi:hypothetical protein